MFIQGNILPKRGGEGGRRRTRTVELEEEMLNRIDQDPKMSVRQISTEMNISKSVVHRVLKEQLLHPFHCQKIHAMDLKDYPARVQFAEWFLEKQRIEAQFVGKVLFTDEAGFGRNGVINCHNLHQWQEDNPHSTIEKSYQQRFHVNVWMGTFGNYLVGPYILPNRLDAGRYLEFLRIILPYLLEDVPLMTRCNMWFMHDGAPPHFGQNVRNHLNNTESMDR